MSSTMTQRMNTRMNTRMTTAIERIADEPRFAERFRADPERALRRYRLNADQVAAIKAGDQASLAAHGLDVMAFSEGKRRGRRRHWRRVVVALATVSATFAMTAAPAAAGKRAVRFSGVRRADARQVRMKRAITVGDVLLERSSIRKGLRRQGLNVRAQGRASLRAFLKIECNLKDCFFDIGDGEPILLAD